MTVRMCLLCFTATLLFLQTSTAQLITGYAPPLYNVPRIINQGLNTYQQTQQIAKAANGLGLPVGQTQKIVTNVALPLLPSAQKLATNVGLPLSPPVQSLQTNVGLPLLPKIFPGGRLPILPQIPSTLTAGTRLRSLPASTLLLNTNPLLPRVSPLQIRSTDEEANTEKEQADAAINPINEVSDDEFKEVVGSSGSFSNETTTDESHQTKPRSSDDKGSEDELEYLSKAANPIDDVGSMMKKIGHGLKHTMQKIDTTLWPSHAKPETKEAQSIDTIPFKTWAQNYQHENNYTLTNSDLLRKYMQILNENRNPEFRIPEELAFPGFMNRNSDVKPETKEAGIDTIPFKIWAQNYQNQNNYNLNASELMHKYLQILNEGRKPEYRIPEELGFLGNRNTLDEFQKSISQSSLLQNGRASFSQKSNNQDINNQDSINQDFYKSSPNKEVNPMQKFWNSAAKLADNFVDAMSQSGKNTNEPSGLSQANNPINKYSEKAHGSVYQMTDSRKDKDDHVASNQRNNPMDKFWNSASKFVGNLADVVSYTEKPNNEVPEKYQKNNPIKNFDDRIYALARNNEAGIMNSEKSHFNQNGHNTESQQAFNPSFWNAASVTGKDAQFGIHPYGYYQGNQQLFYPYSSSFGGPYNQWNHPGYAGSIVNSATNLAHNIAGFNNGAGYYKSSNQPEISSQYTAMFPVLSRTYRQMPLLQTHGSTHFGPSRVPGTFGSTHFGPSGVPGSTHVGPPGVPGSTHVGPPGVPGSTHVGLPRVPGSFGSHFGPVGGPRLFGRGHLGPHVGPLLKRSGSPGNILDSATDLAGSITNIATNPVQTNPGQILGSTGTIFNAATNLAGDISNMATNPGSVQKISNDKLLGSANQGDSLLNPINPVGTIMNSASNLGSKITNLALNPANLANKQLLASAEPLGSVSNQAVDMAGKIVNTALNPGLNGDGQVLQSLSPTYAGGFFPRSNPSGSIVNSATQLASQILNTATTNSGNIGKIPLLKSSPGIGNFAGALPLGSIFNSATKLAGDITNIATAPGKVLVR